jgi:hypothetical protein
MMLYDQQLACYLATIYCNRLPSSYSSLCAHHCDADDEKKIVFLHARRAESRNCLCARASV